MTQNDNDGLSQKLRAWKVQPRVTADFHREVWQRIAARQAARESALWSQMMQWLSDQLVRPRYALALVLVSSSLGLGIAHVQAKEANERYWKSLETRYAASINPLAQIHLIE